MTAPERDRPGSLRPGFTAIELLVAIGILAVLFSLMLVALFKAERAAQCARCQNNLRQIGMALHLFHDSVGTFPTSGGHRGETAHVAHAAVHLGWDVGSGAKHEKVQGRPESAHQHGYWSRVRFGYPDPDVGAADQLGSWSYTVLPFLEGQSSVYEQVDFSASIPVYVCPARRPAEPQSCPDTDPELQITYLTGGIKYWGITDYSVNGLIIQCWPHPMTSISQISDGASNTVLAGEKCLDPQRYLSGKWYWNEPALVGCNSRTGTSIYQDKPGVPFENNWGAAHTSGAGFLFVDGSVRLLRYNLDSTVVMALLTPNGGEVIGSLE